jgi:hypothetical protein
MGLRARGRPEGPAVCRQSTPRSPGNFRMSSERSLSSWENTVPRGRSPLGSVLMRWRRGRRSRVRVRRRSSGRRADSDRGCDVLSISIEVAQRHHLASRELASQDPSRVRPREAGLRSSLIADHQSLLGRIDARDCPRQRKAVHFGLAGSDLGNRKERQGQGDSERGNLHHGARRLGTWR